VDITEVRIKLMGDTGDRLRAFCSITFDDCFVIRDLKIIDGMQGPFVAMPSRKLTARCPKCNCKNHLRASYCNHCGNGLRQELVIKDHDGRAKLYADIAHPINSACREMIQARVIEEYQIELQRSKEPGYRSRYDDFYGEDEVDADDLILTTQPAPQPAKDPEPSEPSLNKPIVEPGRSEPRAPHTTPTRKPTDRPSQQAKRTNFGQGIFE